jgi:hypothetical protein
MGHRIINSLADHFLTECRTEPTHNEASDSGLHSAACVDSTRRTLEHHHGQTRHQSHGKNVHP